MTFLGTQVPSKIDNITSVESTHMVMRNLKNIWLQGISSESQNQQWDWCSEKGNPSLYHLTIQKLIQWLSCARLCLKTPGISQSLLLELWYRGSTEKWADHACWSDMRHLYSTKPQMHLCTRWVNKEGIIGSTSWSTCGHVKGGWRVVVRSKKSLYTKIARHSLATFF